MEDADERFRDSLLSRSLGREPGLRARRDRRGAVGNAGVLRGPDGGPLRGPCGDRIAARPAAAVRARRGVDAGHVHAPSRVAGAAPADGRVRGGAARDHDRDGVRVLVARVLHLHRVLLRLPAGRVLALADRRHRRRRLPRGHLPGPRPVRAVRSCQGAAAGRRHPRQRDPRLRVHLVQLGQPPAGPAAQPAVRRAGRDQQQARGDPRGEHRPAPAAAGPGPRGRGPRRAAAHGQGDPRHARAGPDRDHHPAAGGRAGQPGPAGAAQALRRGRDARQGEPHRGAPVGARAAPRGA